MAKKNPDIVTINGDVGKFTAQKATKDNELKTVKTTVCVIRPDFATIAKLCEDPAAAEAVMEAADEAKAKVEIPARRGELAVRWKAGKKVVSKNNGASLIKIAFDAQKGEVKVEFGEPFTKAVCAFYLDNLGVGHILELEPEQRALDFEGENTESEDDAKFDAAAPKGDDE